MRKRAWIVAILAFSLIISFCCCLQGQAIADDDTANHVCCDMEGGHQKEKRESHGDCNCGNHSISKNIENTNSLQIVPLLLVQEFSSSIESQSHKVNLLSFLKFSFLSSYSQPLFNLYSSYRL